MLEARHYANDVEVDPWQFALELPDLLSEGLCKNQLRWLVCRGFVEHAREITKRNATARTFQPVQCLRFDADSCFVITDAGVAQTKKASVSVPSTAIVPHWNADVRELAFHGLVIKRFRRPARNQEAVLSAFQEESWSQRVDDPLRQEDGKDPKRRLHDTINALNRNQKENLIRFFGDGTGEGICWEERV